MATIDTLRPTATVLSGGWDPSTDTLYEVTSDDSDLTYAECVGTSLPMQLSCGTHTVPPGTRRHLARVRVRGEDGPVSWDVVLPNATTVAHGQDTLPAAVDDVEGGWGLGLPETAEGVYGIRVTGAETGARVTELYLDIDCREAPTFDLDVLEDGTPTILVTGTSAPSVSFTNVDLDDLASRSWRAWIDDGLDIVWDTGIVGGLPTETVVEPLPAGSYNLHGQVWSTIGQNGEYPSAIVDVAFDITAEYPYAPFVEVAAALPWFDLTITLPDLSGYDGDVAVQIQRTDCEESATIALLESEDFQRRVLHITEWDEAEGNRWTDFGNPGWEFWSRPTRWLDHVANDCWFGPYAGPPGPVFSAAAYAFGSQRTVYGLTVGVEYSASFQVSAYTDADHDYVLGVDGIGWGVATAVTTDLDAATATLEYTFTATAASHVLQVALPDPVVDNDYPFDLLMWVLTVTPTGDAPGVTYRDWTAPRTLEGVFCDEPDYDCPLSWRARVIGEVDEKIVASPWSDTTSTSDVVEIERLIMPSGEHLLRAMTPDGPIYTSACGKASWIVSRPFAVSTGVMGARQVMSGAVGGHDLTLSLAVPTEADLVDLSAVLAAPLILASPADSAAQWVVPSASSVKVVQVGRVRTVTAQTTATGPEPVI